MILDVMTYLTKDIELGYKRWLLNVHNNTIVLLTILISYNIVHYIHIAIAIRWISMEAVEWSYVNFIAEFTTQMLQIVSEH